MREYMRAFVKDALLSLQKLSEAEITLVECDKRIYEKVYELPLVNVRDAALIARTMKDLLRVARSWEGKEPYLASKHAFDRLYSACYKAETKSIGRAVDQRIATGLALNRSREMPVVLYLCSYHQNPREAHKALQGKLYVDRYWRDALMKSGHGGLIEYVEPVVKDLMTVQEAMKGPHWLMTAPNCHHTLLPITTEEIMRYGNAQAIIAHHPEARTGFRRDMKTDAQRRRKREELRRETASRIKKRRG